MKNSIKSRESSPSRAIYQRSKENKKIEQNKEAAIKTPQDMKQKLYRLAFIHLVENYWDLKENAMNIREKKWNSNCTFASFKRNLPELRSKCSRATFKTKLSLYERKGGFIVVRTRCTLSDAVIKSRSLRVKLASNVLPMIANRLVDDCELLRKRAEVTQRRFVSNFLSSLMTRFYAFTTMNLSKDWPCHA